MVLSNRQVAAPRLDLAKDGGVFENEPAVRTDVVRSDEFEPDVIPAAQMRSTRAMWARKQLEGDQTYNKSHAREVSLHDSKVQTGRRRGHCTLYNNC